MYNQPSVKPQGNDSMIFFQKHTVSTDGREFNPPAEPFGSAEINFNTYREPENTIQGYVFNKAEGKRMFLTYCAVCHGADGQLNQGEGTRISLKGLKVAKIRKLPTGYYYERLKRGGVQMPPISYRLSDQERWDTANYINRELLNP